MYLYGSYVYSFGRIIKSHFKEYKQCDGKYILGSIFVLDSPWKMVRTTSHATGPLHGMLNTTNTVIRVMAACN